MTDQIEKQQHFVTFHSPGTFVSEQSARPVDSWDIEAAQAMALGITERHGAIPYGFQFSTRGRTADALDSHEIARSPFYWLGGVVETLEQVEARATEQDQILLDNMRGNHWRRIITNYNSYRWTQPLGEDDIVLDVPQCVPSAEGAK
jgi:hypothetical protein